MKTGAIIRQLRKQRGISAELLARHIGLSATTVYRYENGAIEKVPARILAAIARELDVSIWQLIEQDDSAQDALHAAGIDSVPQIQRVPRLGVISCGKPLLAMENIAAMDDVPSFIHCDFTLVCRGDSMTGARIFDGDIVCIRQQPRVENGQIAAVLIDDEATLKRVYAYPDHLVLNAENPAYPPMIFSNDNRHQIRILGLAVYFISRVR
jgi:repressor LexA